MTLTADYQESFRQQRILLTNSYAEACLFTFNDCTFSLTSELLKDLETQLAANQPPILVKDKDQNDVEVVDAVQFLTDATIQYNQVSEKFGADWQALKAPYLQTIKD